MNLISVLELSKKIGISTTKIYDAIRSEKIPCTMIDGNKKVDTDNPDVKDFMQPNYQRMTIQPSQTGKKKTSKKKKTIPMSGSEVAGDMLQKVFGDLVDGKAKKKAVKIAEEMAEGDQDDEGSGEYPDIPEEILNMIDSSELTLQMALKLPRSILDKIKMHEQIKKIQTDADKLREKLVDRRLVRTVFAKLYEIDLHQLLALKEKLIPDIAAVFGVNDPELKLKAGEIIDESLWGILANIKRELNLFLEKIDENAIE